MKWSSIAAGSLWCLLATHAWAGDAGFYGIATIGSGDERPESDGLNFANSLVVVHLDPDRIDADGGSLAWGVGLGYRVNRYLAGEVEYVDFGTTDIHEHYNVPGSGPVSFPTEFDLNYSSTVTGPVLSVLGTLPLGESFEVFLRGGALFASREYSAGGAIRFGQQEQKFASTVWLAGAGATYSFARHWGVRAEYQQSGMLDKTLITGETRVKRVSVSALYRF